MKLVIKKQLREKDKTRLVAKDFQPQSKLLFCLLVLLLSLQSTSVRSQVAR